MIKWLVLPYLAKNLKMDSSCPASLVDGRVGVVAYQNGEIERLTSNSRLLIEQFINFPVYFGDEDDDENDDDDQEYAITAALTPANERKNRYVDILPYDKTRVHLDQAGGYINANYVTMTTGDNRHRRWIASQGPLESTSDDFWRMVINNNVNLIVMVTQLAERNRPKCHQYWPDELDPSDDAGVLKVDDFNVRLIQQSPLQKGLAERVFELQFDDENIEKRTIRHLQFVNWPDHGVPSDPGDFVDFVLRVNQLKTDSEDELTLVHCSAGVGRTGVTISIDAAIENIRRLEKNGPIELLWQMRQQRACLIQTPIQFKFVCDTIVLLTSYLWPITP